MAKNALCLIFLMILGCSNMPISSKDVSVKVLSGHIATVTAYEIPKGTCRGAIWGEGCEYFTIRNIEKFHAEIMYDIPIPIEFFNAVFVSDEWGFRVDRIIKNRLFYSASKKDRSISLEIDLPAKKRPYDIYGLRSTAGNEMIVFVDVSETIVDTALFGCIIVSTADPEKRIINASPVQPDNRGIIRIQMH